MRKNLEDIKSSNTINITKLTQTETFLERGELSMILTKLYYDYATMTYIALHDIRT